MFDAQGGSGAAGEAPSAPVVSFNALSKNMRAVETWAQNESRRVQRNKAGGRVHFEVVPLYDGASGACFGLAF